MHSCLCLLVHISTHYCWVYISEWILDSIQIFNFGTKSQADFLSVVPIYTLISNVFKSGFLLFYRILNGVFWIFSLISYIRFETIFVIIFPIFFFCLSILVFFRTSISCILDAITYVSCTITILLNSYFFILFLLHFIIISKKKQGCTFNTLLGNLLS